MSLLDPVILNKLDLLKKSVGSGGGSGLGNISIPVQGDVTSNQPLYFVDGVGITGVPPVISTGINATSFTAGSTYDSTSIGITRPTDIKWIDDGNKLAMASSFSNIVLTLDASTPYDITTLTFAGGSSSFSITNASDIDWSSNGLIFNVNDGSNYRSYSVTVPFRFTGATLLGSTAMASRTNIEFLPGGNSFIAINNSDTLEEYEVSTTYRSNTYVSDPLRTITLTGARSARFISNGHQMIVTRSTTNFVDIYDLSIPYNISTMVLRHSYNTGVQRDCDITDPSGNIYYVRGTLSVALTSRLNNTSIPLTFNITDVSSNIGYSLETVASTSTADLLLKSTAKIEYPVASVGDVLYLNSSGNLELNTSGDRIGICIIDGYIHLSEVEDFSNYIYQSRVREISSVGTHTLLNIHAQEGYVGEIVISAGTTLGTEIESLLVTTGDLVDFVIRVNTLIDADGSAGGQVLRIPFDFKFKESITIKLVNSASGVFRATTFYKLKS